MGDLSLDPRIVPADDPSGRLSIVPPGQSGNIVAAHDIATSLPASQVYSGNYNQTIGQVAEVLKTTGLVVGTGSSAASKALQIEYSQRAQENNQAIQQQAAVVQQDAQKYNSAYAVAAIVGNLNNQLSQTSNQMASINAAASLAQSNISSINAAIAKDNVDRLSRNSAIRNAANADLKLQYANLQTQQVTLGNLANNAAQVQSQHNEVINYRNSIAASVGVSPDQLNDTINKGLAQGASNIQQGFGELNQRVNNAVNDQNQYLKNQQIASYGQQSGAALQTIALGMADIGQGNFVTGGAKIGESAIDFSPSFAPSLIPFGGALKASVTGLAEGFQTGSPEAAAISWGNTMGGLMQFDRATQSAAIFDSYAAKGDLVGMSAAWFSTLGNGLLGVQQIGSNFSGLAPGYGQIFDMAVKGAGNLSNNVGAALLNGKSNANELSQVGAMGYNLTFNTLNDVSGGLTTQMAAFGNSINHLFEGTLGNPSNRPVQDEARALFSPGGIFDPGPGVAIDNVEAYKNGLSGSLIFGPVTMDSFGFRGLDATLRTDGIANATLNIALNTANGEPNINLPMRMDAAMGLRPFNNDGMTIFGGNPFEGSDNPGSPNLGGTGFGSVGAAELGNGMLPYNPNDLSNPQNPNSPFNPDNPLNPANDPFGFGNLNDFGMDGLDFGHGGMNFGNGDLGHCVTGCWGPNPGNPPYDPDPYHTGMRGEDPPPTGYASENPPEPPPEPYPNPTGKRGEEPPNPNPNPKPEDDCCHGSWCDADCFEYDASLPQPQPGTPGSNPPPPPPPPDKKPEPPPKPPKPNPNPQPKTDEDKLNDLADAAGAGESLINLYRNL